MSILIGFLSSTVCYTLSSPSGVIVNDLMIRERLAAPEKCKMVCGMLRWNVLGRENELLREQGYLKIKYDFRNILS